MIDLFKNEHEFLSNFYEAPVVYNGHEFRNSESAYQAAKFPDDQPRFTDMSGAEAKNHARKNKLFVRPDWQEISLRVMSEVVHAKFAQNKDLRALLIRTQGHKLVEGNWWHDNFYGSCRCQKKPECNGCGLNWLGRIEMAEREYWISLMSNTSILGAQSVYGLQHNGIST